MRSSTSAMVSFEIASHPEKSRSDAGYVRNALREFNASVIGEDDFRPIWIFARNDSAELIGGLLGEAYWRWLHIENLWLRREYRRRGYGKRMIQLAESEALRHGCQFAFLDTFSFQARPVYERLGYRVVGTISDFPPGHERYFMVKPLGARGAA